MFTQPFIQAQINENTKARVTGLCEGNSRVAGELITTNSNKVRMIFTILVAPFYKQKCSIPVIIYTPYNIFNRWYDSSRSPIFIHPRNSYEGIMTWQRCCIITLLEGNPQITDGFPFQMGQKFGASTFLFFFFSLNEQTVELPMIWDAVTLITII